MAGFVFIHQMAFILIGSMFLVGSYASTTTDVLMGTDEVNVNETSVPTDFTVTIETPEDESTVIIEDAVTVSIISEGTSATIENITLVEEETTMFEGQSTVVEGKMTESSEETTIIVEDITVSQEETTVVEVETIQPSEQTTIIVEDITVSQEQTTVVEGETIKPSEETTIIVEYITMSQEESTVLIVETNTPSENTTILAESHTATLEESTPVGEETTTTTVTEELPTVEGTSPDGITAVENDSTMSEITVIVDYVTMTPEGTTIVDGTTKSTPKGSTVTVMPTTMPSQDVTSTSPQEVTDAREGSTMSSEDITDADATILPDVTAEDEITTTSSGEITMDGTERTVTEVEMTDVTKEITITPADMTEQEIITTRPDMTEMETSSIRTTVMVPTTAPTTASTTTSATPDREPADLEGKTYKIAMMLAILFEFTDDLDDQTSDLYKMLAQEIKIKLTLIMLLADNTPEGFDAIVILGFRRRMNIPNTLKAIANDDDIIADYNITYTIQSLQDAEDAEEVLTFIETSYTERVSNLAFFNDSGVDEEFLQTYNNNILRGDVEKILNDQVTDPCLADTLCSSCKLCETEKVNGVRDSFCTNQCLDGKVCGVQDDNDEQYSEECVCPAKFVDFANTCVNQNIIIGVFSGVGGALLLGLIIGVTVLSCSKRKLADESDFEDRDLTNVSSRGFKSGPGFVNPTYQSTGLYGTGNGEIPVVDYGSSMGTFRKLDDNLGSGFESMRGTEPLMGDLNDVNSNPTVAALKDTEAYKSFNATVSHVDPDINYFADRPRIILRGSMDDTPVKVEIPRVELRS